MPNTKWIFISGGVLSSLGKGLLAASIGKLLQSRGYKIVPIKSDGYLNVDPGTMRLGGQKTVMEAGGLAKEIYGKNEIRERFRHRYEINPEYHKVLKENGVNLSGLSKREKNIVQMIELDGHPFYFGRQFHPEFTSRFERPNPVFKEFVKSCIEA